MPAHPPPPDPKEREEHDLTHVPYRSWCEHCVSGNKASAPHRGRDQEERSVPEISLDYAYIRDEDEEASETILVTKDWQTKVTFASLVTGKGVNA